jgi:hypothetical protein
LIFIRIRDSKLALPLIKPQPIKPIFKNLNDICQYHLKTDSVMSLKTIIKCLIALLLVPALNAQNKPKWGPDNVMKEKPDYFGGIACQDESGAVLWYIEEKGGIKKTVSLFESYDSDMKLLASVSPPELYKDSETQFFRAFKFGQNIYALFLGNSDGKLALMAWPLDRQTMRTYGEPIHLYDVQKKFSKQDLRYGLTFFQLAFNEDATELAIVFHYDAHKGIRTLVFDRSLKMLWEKEHYTDRLMEYTPFRDHKIHFQHGVVALMYSSVMTKEEHNATDQNGWDNHAYHALIFKNKGTVVQDVWINLGKGCFPISLEVFPQSNGTTRCVGAYSNKHGKIDFLPSDDDNRPFAGVYEAYISAEGKILNDPIKSMLLPFLSANKASYEKSTKRNYEKNAEIIGFEPRLTVPMPEDALALVFEYVYASKESQNKANEDIIVAKIDKSGKLSWANIVPKKQTYAEFSMMRYTSFGLFTDADKLHFIYMADARPTATCALSTIDGNGKVTTVADWLPADQNFGAMPRYGIAGNGNIFLMPALKAKTEKMGLLKF